MNRYTRYRVENYERVNREPVPQMAAHLTNCEANIFFSTRNYKIALNSIATGAIYELSKRLWVTKRSIEKTIRTQKRKVKIKSTYLQTKHCQHCVQSAFGKGRHWRVASRGHFGKRASPLSCSWVACVSWMNGTWICAIKFTLIVRNSH